MGEGLLAIPVLLAALAGGALALAAREAVLAAPGLVRWMRDALEPLRRAGLEGYAPTEVERHRLALLGATALPACGLVAVGPEVAPLLALAGPLLATWALARRRSRYRRAVERGIPAVARAIADALSGGRSVRAALAAAGEALDGPPAVELARIGADLELVAPTADALGGLRSRLHSPRVDALCAALLSQRLGGGDLAGVLRRLATAAGERDRADADARSATAQARFTGLLVVAMPAGAGLFAELLEPGFIGGLLARSGSAMVLAIAVALQLLGFAVIRRLARIVDEP